MTAREISQQIAEGFMAGINDVATLRKIKLFGLRLEREIIRYTISEIKNLGDKGGDNPFTWKDIIDKIAELENQIKETYNDKGERNSK